MLGSVEFDYHVVLRKSDIPHITRRIAELIEPAASGRLRTVRVNRRDELPVGVKDVWAHHRREPREAFLGTAWGGSVDAADVARLEAVLRAKEERLSRVYRASCDQVWLVMVFDTHAVASMAYVPLEFRFQSSTFDRVIALQGWTYTTELWHAAA